MSTQFVGSGKNHFCALKSSRLFLILFISVSLAQSLAFVEYHPNATNAIVHSIARIVSTTINSTRVKAFLEDSPLIPLS